MSDLVKYAGHGGKRPGAGRPKKLTNQIARAEKLAEKLSLGTKAGLSVVADAMPDLMKIAVASALGDKDNRPNVSMLKFLIEVGMNSITDENISGGSMTERILKEARSVELHQHNYQVPVSAEGNPQSIRGTSLT